MGRDPSSCISNLLPYNSNSVFESPPEGFQTEHWSQLVNNLAELFNAPTVFITQANQKGIEILSVNDSLENPYSIGMTIPLEVDIFCHEVVQKNAELYVKNATEEKKWDNNPQVTNEKIISYLGFPLHWPNGLVFGTLCIMDTQATDYNEKLIRVQQNLKNIIDYELNLIEKNQQLRSLSVLDDLTGLYNRRGFFETAMHLVSMAARMYEMCSVLYIDLNNVKFVNKRYGHEYGDKLIKGMGQVIKSTIRAHDIAARVGEDEFLILAVVKDRDAMSHLIRRLRKAAQSVQIFVPNERNAIPLDFSAGQCVGEIEKEEELKAFLETAEQRMYEDRCQHSA